jgi:hypothetical protein
MLKRAAPMRLRRRGGKVLRVASIEDMIRQITALVNTSTCLGKLVVWYHGAPEIQLVSQPDQSLTRG